MSNETPRPANDSTGLLDLVDGRILWRRKWTVLACIVLAVAAGGAYISQETPIYEVTCRMLVQLERFGTEKEALLRTDRTFLITQGELLRCPVVVENALRSLQKTPGPTPTYAETEAITKSLHVSTVDDANVLKLTFRNPDSEYGVRVLHAVMGSYQAYIKDMQHGSIQDTLQVIAQHEQELRKELERLEQRYYQLRQDSRLIGQGGDAFRSYAGMLEQLGQRLTEARSRRIDKEIQVQSLAKIQAPQGDLQLAVATLPGTPLSAAQLNALANAIPQGEVQVAAPLLPADPPAPLRDDATAAIEQLLASFPEPVRIQAQLWQAETRAKETSQVYGPEHPIRRANDQQIAMWKERLKDWERTAPMILAQELATLKQIEANLTSEHEAEFAKVKELDASLLREQQCLADIQRVQAIHDSTAKQLRELSLADEVQSNGQISIMVRLIEPPDATSKLVWPRPLQFLGLCAVLGLAGGFVLVTLAERWRASRLVAA